MSELFSILKDTIEEFVPESPLATEYFMERELRRFLEKKGLIVTRQVTKKMDRYDLLCRKNNQLVCIELKLIADISDLKQFDKYLPKFKDGLIVLCWQATRSVREIFAEVTKQSPIPVCLIELSKKYSLA